MIKRPTHAALYVDNWDGEKTTEYGLIYFDGEGMPIHFESGGKLIQYVGDCILKLWKLDDSSKVEIPEGFREGDK